MCNFAEEFQTKQPLAVSHWPLAKQRTPHQRHPELVSGSVRGEGKEKARGEMLKQVQHDVTKKRRLTRREAEGE